MREQLVRARVGRFYGVGHGIRHDDHASVHRTHVAYVASNRRRHDDDEQRPGG